MKDRAVGAVDQFLSKVSDAPADRPANATRQQGAGDMVRAALVLAARLSAALDDEREAATTTLALVNAAAQPVGEALESLEAASHKVAIVDSVARQTAELLNQARAEVGSGVLDERVLADALEALQALVQHAGSTRQAMARATAACLQASVAVNDTAPHTPKPDGFGSL